MKAVVTCEENGIRFYLTPERLATDIPDRAGSFRDGTDAALAAGRERLEPAWKTQRWEPAFLFSDGTRWRLTLACGCVVERKARYRLPCMPPCLNTYHGARRRPDVLPPPKSCRCEFCRSASV